MNKPPEPPKPLKPITREENNILPVGILIMMCVIIIGMMVHSFWTVLLL